MTNPHGDGVARGVAHGPVVAHVFAGVGFGGAPKARAQHGVHAEGEGARVAVGEDVAHDEGGACAL